MMEQFSFIPCTNVMYDNVDEGQQICIVRLIKTIALSVTSSPDSYNVPSLNFEKRTWVAGYKVLHCSVLQ